MFACCPNITRLETSVLLEEQHADSLGRFIAEVCPKIAGLMVGSAGDAEYSLLGFRIMDSLTTQQIANYNYKGDLRIDYGPAVNITFQRHSTTLRSITLTGSGLYNRISLSVILRDCRYLEVLSVGFCDIGGFFVPLDDILRHPWSSTRLNNLSLGISGCELPEEPNVKPYYLRPAPVTLTDDEIQHFAQLGELYRRIGALTELRELDLLMVPLDENGEVVEPENEQHFVTSFPAMLSLEVTSQGLPGFLHLFSGLKNLKDLRGSVDTVIN
ncbi:MAG: hypothetical protein J3R72DRAFT_422178 [Linnemannia gamsii]|nr:MAG: hypothetical protein J3R72DRAFT_422178 [Linnemannia gamsii]